MKTLNAHEQRVCAPKQFCAKKKKSKSVRLLCFAESFFFFALFAARRCDVSRRKKNKKIKVSKLTLAIAFLYLMTACWMSACTLIFPSPHGTTTRVLPKHTVTFMVRSPGSDPDRGGGGGGGEARSGDPSGSQREAAAAWRSSPGVPRAGERTFNGVSGSPRRTTLFWLFSDHLFSFCPSLSPSFLPSLWIQIPLSSRLS